MAKLRHIFCVYQLWNLWPWFGPVASTQGQSVLLFECMLYCVHLCLLLWVASIDGRLPPLAARHCSVLYSCLIYLLG